MFFKHFAIKNQLPGLSVNGTLVENGLTISPIQIGKILIDVWLALTSLPSTGCWLHMLIFRLVGSSVHQKDEFASLALLWNQQNLLKEAWPAANTKQGLKMSYIGLTGFCKNHFLNPLSTNPTKWSNTIKHTQFAGYCRGIVCVCLSILWGWHLKGWR